MVYISDLKCWIHMLLQHPRIHCTLQFMVSSKSKQKFPLMVGELTLMFTRIIKHSVISIIYLM